MRRYPPPLGTTFDAHANSWIVVRIGTGKTIKPALTDVWSKHQAMTALRREQGRDVPVVSPQLRRVKTAEVA